MSELLIKILVFAYASVGIVAAIGYIPTIKDLFIHKKMSANIDSYIIWSLSAGITFLYALFILKDLLFRIVSGVNFVCCAIILALSLFLKYSKNQSMVKKQKKSRTN